MNRKVSWATANEISEQMNMATSRKNGRIGLVKGSDTVGRGMARINLLVSARVSDTTQHSGTTGMKPAACVARIKLISPMQSSAGKIRPDAELPSLS